MYFSRRLNWIYVSDEKESGKTELVRPLPWLLFLPCLMILRLIRVIVNIGAFIFNYPKITSSEMVCHLHSFNINIA